MSNPLIEKFEEIYGEKKEEEVIEEKSGMDKLKEVVSNAMNRGLPSGMSEDTIILNPNNGFASTNFGYPSVKQTGLTIGNACETNSGDFVIPTATVNNGAINMNGGYISPSTLTKTTPNTFLLPQTTGVERQMCKVMDDVAKGKAVVSEIKSEIDPSFKGFGGQIRYTIEIVATYP